MSGDSIPIALPLARSTSEGGEVSSLYRDLRKPLLRYLVCLGLSVDEAQDTIQDAFLSLHRHLAAAGSRENIRSWVFRVAHNRARNCQGSYHRRFGESLDGEIDATPDPTTPERVMLEKEKFRRLGEAIGELTEAERESLLLRAEGLRYREIGEVLGISTSTVGETVNRAIRKLAEKCDV
jgi:RNA polymerase sigma-70 factor, ECF subfamily